ncbi:MAG: primosomal protein N' [Mycobacteriales bacterium]
MRYAGQQVEGYVLARVARSPPAGQLAFLTRAVSAEPVLSAEVAALARAVADRYAGTLADVLRLAVPPRAAKVEASVDLQQEPERPPAPAASTWAAYPPGAAFLAAVGSGGAPRAVWTALPGPGWPGEIAAAVQAALAGGRGALVVVPDGRDLDRVDAALSAALGPGRHVALSADLGPSQRYRRWLAVRRGAVRAVVGTRAAMFAPVADLGLVVVWDDGDDLHAEPRAPYPHVRTVLSLRAHACGAAALIGGLSRTAEGAALVRSGWARPLAAGRDAVRAAAPRVEAAGTDADLARDPAARTARLPTLTWTVARAALAAGAPVLVQVPRRGYQPTLACDSCRTPARCTACAGPLGRAAGGPDTVPACRWCGRPAAAWRCPACQASGLRAGVTGARRTAEELGRAFPGVAVRTSGRDGVLARVQDRPALVVSTPGAEPVADGGYGAVLLLDGWALLGRPDLRAGEETLRRWLAAAALARPAAQGGRVVVLADASLQVVQALIRWDPAGFAERELDERVALGFPPAVRMAALSGPREALADYVAAAADDLPVGTELLGPVELAPRAADVGPGPPVERMLARIDHRGGAALAAALKAGLVARSARKPAETVRVQLDPLDVL